MSNNRSVLFDVLNNDFTEKTRGLKKEEKIKAIGEYFTSKAADGFVGFAFINGDCIDTRLKRRETFKSIIDEAGRIVTVNLEKGGKLNLESIFSENAICSYAHWLKGDKCKNLDSSCVVYSIDKKGQPTAILGYMEGYYTKNDFGVRIDSICLPETDYIIGNEMVREREKIYNNDKFKPTNDSFQTLKERLVNIEKENENEEEIDLPGVGEVLEDVQPVIELEVEYENDGIEL